MDLFVLKMSYLHWFRLVVKHKQSITYIGLFIYCVFIYY